MSLSKQFLSKQFKSAALEYIALGLYREAELAERHAEDVLRLPVPRILYVTEDGPTEFYFEQPGRPFSRNGPYRKLADAENAAWRQIERTSGEKPYAVVYVPPKKVAADAAE